METRKKNGVIFLLLAFAIVLTVFSFLIPKSSNKANPKSAPTNENQKPWEIDWGNTQSAEIEYRRNESQNTTQQEIGTNNPYDTSSQHMNMPTNHNSSSIYVANPEVDPSQYISRTKNNPQYAIDYSEQDRYYRASQNNNVEYSSNNYNSYENSNNSYSVPAPQRTPSTITNCDSAGCWGTDGTRYNKGAGDTYFPSNGGSCQSIDGQMQCN